MQPGINRMERLLERLSKPVLVVAALLLTLALFTVRELGADATNHLSWMRAFPAQVFSGDLRPTWLPEAYAGLGSPTFYFYPPLTYWFSAPFVLAFGWLSDYHLYAVISLAASVLSYLSFRYYLSVNRIEGSMLKWAPLLFVVAPYRSYELFNQSGLSTHFAVIFIPLIFAGIDGLLRGSKRAKHFVVLAASYCALILSNIPMLVMTSIALLVYFVILLVRRSPSLGSVVMGALCGVFLAAFYLVPIPFLRPLVQTDYLTVPHSAPVDAVASFFNLLRRYDITESVHTVLSIASALGLVALLLLIWRKRSGALDHRLTLVLCATALVAFMQIFLLSKPFWSIDIARTLIQYPHRWNQIFLFAAALAFATLKVGSYRRMVLAGVIVWGLATTGFAVLIAFNLRVNPHGKPVTPYDPPEYAPVFAPHEKSVVIGIAREHTNDAQVLPLRELGGNESVREVLHAATESRYEVSAASNLPVRFQQWRWPYWELRSSKGQAIPVTSDASGLLTATLPPGQDTYQLELVESREEKIGLWLTVFGGLLVALIAMRLRRLDRSTQPRTDSELTSAAA